MHVAWFLGAEIRIFDVVIEEWKSPDNSNQCDTLYRPIDRPADPLTLFQPGAFPPATRSFILWHFVHSLTRSSCPTLGLASQSLSSALESCLMLILFWSWGLNVDVVETCLGIYPSAWHNVG